MSPTPWSMLEATLDALASRGDGALVQIEPRV